jgi:hypothetical protein
MLVMPMSLPLVHTDTMFNDNGDASSQAGTAAKLVGFVPINLSRLVRYATAIREIRLAFPQKADVN